MRYASSTLLALVALACQLGGAEAHDERVKRHADFAHKLDKRYPPDRATTYSPTTTPAYVYETTSNAPTPTTSRASVTTPASQTTPAAGQFDPNSPTRALVAATTTWPATCAPTYVAPSMVTGTGTLPRPTTFVTKAPREVFLRLNNQPFTIVGPNIYWLCQDENYGPLGSYTDKRRVREALAIAVAMGANTIRAHSCGISVGTYAGRNPYNLEPTVNNLNEAAWDIRDYVLFAAREYGLRIIWVLTDNYAYYHGGKYDYLNFRGASLANGGAAFYTNRAVISAYLWYIDKFMQRTNPYTGVRYVDDPTILAWETGNELGGYIEAEMWPPASWTTQINNYIRRFDTRHLLLDGTNGFWNYSTNAIAPAVGLRYSQMITDHGYPRNTGIIQREIEISQRFFKNFLIGEYDWTTTQSSVSLDAYLALIEANKPNIGDMIWNVMGHEPDGCRFISHNDGYSMYYPNGNSLADQANILKVVQHWYRMRNLTPPSQLVGVTLPQPEF